ncbi:MAG: ABC transporter permease subunit [Faecousia sp.]
MTILKHELRRDRLSLTVWTASIGFLIAVCIFLFPEMKGEMDSVSALFSSMGSFSAAFGMDKVSFGTLTGFYAVECGNILGLGGAFFAALCSVNTLAKEEKEHTAEFLLTHPVSRRRVVAEKLAAVLLQILVINLCVYALALLSVLLIGEPLPFKEFTLLHLAYLLLQIELAGICFGISAFLRRGGIGIGLGIAILLYFLNLISNLTEKAEALRYITPFAYAEGTDIVTSLRLDVPLVLLGISVGILAAALGFIRYSRKDIAA